MILYTDIEGLPEDHPKVIEFMKEQKDMDDCYADGGGIVDMSEDSIDYFNRYIAGDR